MAYLASPSETKAVLDMFGFSFKKKYGQNFLIDEKIVRKIVRSSGVTKNDTVLEIGPGIGTMTQILSEEAGKVVAVEIDKGLMDILHFTLKDCGNVTVINNDILKCDILKLAEEYNDGKPFKVVANLPYYITSPIIMGLLENNATARRKGKIFLESVTIMIQKEVAQRINAQPGTKDYGALSLAVEFYSASSYEMTVPAAVFMPRPNVDSAVIKLDVYKEPPFKVQDEKLLFGLIKAAFAQRRKTFVNTVSSVGGFEKEKLREALSVIGKDENVRGETLTLGEFVKISDFLLDKM